jgi:RNA polymerase sigma-70 factor, ECF subfamily
LRRNKRVERKHDELGRDLETRQEMAVENFDAAIEDDIGDDLLRLMFTACHPVLSTEARVALTLRLLGGLTTEEIARAFLVPEPTVRGDLLTKLGRFGEARAEFERAASLTRNVRERELLLDRAASCARGSLPPELQ